MNKYDTFPADFNTALQIVCIGGVWQVTVKTPVQLEASPPGTSSARILASVGEGKLSRSDRICEAQQPPTKHSEDQAKITNMLCHFRGFCVWTAGRNNITGKGGARTEGEK